MPGSPPRSTPGCRTRAAPQSRLLLPSCRLRSLLVEKATGTPGRPRAQCLLSCRPNGSRLSCRPPESLPRPTPQAGRRRPPPTRPAEGLGPPRGTRQAGGQLQPLVRQRPRVALGIEPTLRHGRWPAVFERVADAKPQGGAEDRGKPEPACSAPHEVPQQEGPLGSARPLTFARGTIENDAPSGSERESKDESHPKDENDIGRVEARQGWFTWSAKGDPIRPLRFCAA